MPRPFPPHTAITVLLVMVIFDIGVYVVVPLGDVLKATELIAIPSSPVPRIKLLVAVKLLPTVPFSETLLRLQPSAQIDVKRLFLTTPPVPEAHMLDSTC